MRFIPDKPLSLKSLDLVRQIHWVATSWEHADRALAKEMRLLADRFEALAERTEKELRRLG